MKNHFWLLPVFVCASTFVRAQVNYTWTGASSSAWNNAANWSPAGLPGAADNVKVVTGSNICLLNAAMTINNINVATGTLDLGSFTLTVAGATATFAQGTVQNGTMLVSGATTTTFGNGPLTMNCVVNVTSAGITFRNTVFQNTVNITKTGSGNDACAGSNIFNGPVTITNAGAGYLSLANGNPDQFNAAASFITTGTGNLSVANNSTNNVFNGGVTFTNTPSAAAGILVSTTGINTVFNDNILVASSAGQGVLFCGSTSATAILAAGKTITVSGTGFSAGTLSMKQFTQTGATAQNLAITGAGALLFGRLSTFGGDVTASAPTLYLNGSTFNGATSLTKTGTTGDFSSGGNTFNGVTAITNSGSSYLVLGNSSPDIWNGDVTFTDNGSERLLPCWATAGNQFNGNIYVNTSGAATGVQFCGGNATATATLAATKSVFAGSGGLTAGYLYLKQFTQLGNAPVNLTATGPAAVYLGPKSSFGGAVTVTAPDIWAQGATYASAATFTKTGGNYNHNNQYQNIFNSTCTINQQSSSGYFMLGYNSNDQFKDDIILSSSGTGGIYLGWTGGTGTPTQDAGKTILVGSAGFSAGFLSLNTFTQNGSAPMNLAFTGTATNLIFARGSVIGGALTSNTPDILLNGATFKSTVDITKTGASNDQGAGGNIFQAGGSVTNAGGGWIMLGNANPDTWNGAATFTSTGTSFIAPAWNSAGNQFNGDIVVSSTGSAGGVQFCGGSAASATQAAGGTVRIGSGGFSSGSLLLRQFTQLGSVPVTLTLSGPTTLVQVGPASAIGGNFTAVSPRVLLNGAVYTGSVTVTKTGATGEWSTGGNTFNGTATINQQGGGFFGFANGSPDIYNGDLYANNNSTERIIFGNTPVGNQFNGNIILTQTGASVGIAFGWSGATSETQASGKTISVGGAGFSTGYLLLQRFTQLGSAAVNLPLTGASNLTFGPTSVFNGNVTSTSGSLYFNGCTFNGTVNSTKTGTSNDASAGNNVFNDVTTLVNAGSGYLMLGNGNLDQFNAATTFTNTGSSQIYVAYNSSGNLFGGPVTFTNSPSANSGIFVSWLSAGTVFNDNIVVNSSAGQGVQFCGGNTTAGATLAAGKTIVVGSSGFSAGTLLLRQFTQTGTTPQSLTLTGTGNLTFGPASAFGGNLSTVSPTLFFNGGTFGGTVTAAKNGGTNDASAGNNTFTGPFSVTNTGAGYFLMGNGSPDIWQSAAIFNNYSSAQSMYTAYNSAGNIFNDDVLFNNRPGTTGAWIYPDNSGSGTQFNGNISVVNVNGGGVYFGSNTGTATLAAGKTITVGAGGFASGGLILRGFSQSGLSTPQSLTTTGTSYLQFGPGAAFDGNMTSSSPGLFYNGAVFNGTVGGTKTGTSNDQSLGNNIFNGPSLFTNQGNGYLVMCYSGPDAYNANVSFVQTTSGGVYPNYNNTGTYSKNLTITSPSAYAVTLGGSAGTAVFSGNTPQTIAVTGSTPVPVFTRLAINNSSSGVTLGNTPIIVSNTLTLTSGLLNTTTTNLLTMANGATAPALTALSTSYVNGPMRFRKSTPGATTLNFPVGNGADCRPVTLTVNHTTGNLYTYQVQLFNASAAALNYTLPFSVDAVSTVHYYTITRLNASLVSQPTLELSGNQSIQVFYGSNDIVTNGGTLTIVKNTYTAPNAWIDIGGGGGPVYTGANLSGSVTSTSAPSAFNSFSTFALGDHLGGGNVLPVRLLDFQAALAQTTVNLNWTTSTESNNNYFMVEKSADGATFQAIRQVFSKAVDGNSDIALTYQAADPAPYAGKTFYRLKQVDRNGNTTYSGIVAVNTQPDHVLSVFPNPTSGRITIKGLAAGQSSLSVEWFDAGGKVVYRQQLPVTGGSASGSISVDNGIYFLRFPNGNGGFEMRNIVVRK